MVLWRSNIHRMVRRPSLAILTSSRCFAASARTHSSVYSLNPLQDDIAVSRPNSVPTTTSCTSPSMQMRTLLCAVRHASTNTKAPQQQSPLAEDPPEEPTTVTSSSSAVSALMQQTLRRCREQSQEDTKALFERSVQARTVGNKQLKAFIDGANGATDWQLVEAAVAGARSGGLRPNAQTNDSLLALYVEGGRLKQALELYNLMTSERLTPTTKSYNTLMRLCLDRDMASSVQTIFEDMKRRGRAPNGESYELFLSALATERPPRWEKAVEIFEKMSRSAHNTSVYGSSASTSANNNGGISSTPSTAGAGPVKMTTNAYIALMTVYGNMQPFDWRVVYNCYYELRQRHPMVPLTWEAYAVVAKNLKKGRAGVIRRCLTYADAWFVLTHIRSPQFWVGLTIFMFITLGIKGLLGYLVTLYKGQWDSSRQHNAQSVMHS